MIPSYSLEEQNYMCLLSNLIYIAVFHESTLDARTYLFKDVAPISSHKYQRSIVLILEDLGRGL